METPFELYRSFENDLAALIGPVRFSPQANLRLDRITHLLELLGDPHNAYPSLHIGGTSGKGSTATMIAAILTQAGYKTGLHLSPHLQILNELYQINNHVTPTTRLVELYAEIKPAIAQVAAETPFGAPSYSEAQVALGFYLFQQEAVDTAVVEVGLGGTLDATNVLNAAVVVITSIGLDHTAILGDTVEEIASHKAGIIKPGQTVISGVRQPEARQVVAQRCRSQNAKLWQLGEDFDYQILDEGHFTLSMPAQTYLDLELGLKGDFQIANAACGIAAVLALPDFDIPETAIRDGLRSAHIPGRMEIIQSTPLVILDGAHNPDKMETSSSYLNDLYGDRRRIVVFSLKSDKAADEILPLLLEGTDLLTLTAFRVKHLWEPMAPESLADIAQNLSPNLEIRIIADPLAAVEQALSEAGPDDLVWVTGSLYLVGDVREYWYPTETLIQRAEEGLSGSLTF